jgi:hypothetical protein
MSGAPAAISSRISKARMQLNKLDLAALCALVGSALVLGWPIWTGGNFTYMDNPVHLAELQALANGEQWSDIGFCGFPLGYLHSPIWYGGLSVFVWMGIEVGAVFSVLLLIASLCPSVAIYLVGRRALPPLAALVPAWLLLVQRTAVVGYGSVFAGMATFYIASGLLIVFVDLLARSDHSWRQARYITLCLALLALTHLYALLAAMFVIVIHSTRLLVLRPVRWRITLGRDSVAYALAAICSSLYWYPVIRGISSSAIEPQNLGPRALLMRLFIPTDVLEGVQTDFFLIDALPLTALVLLGLAGLVRVSRWPDATSLYGALLALGVGVLLFVVQPITQSAWMGPNSWRFLYVVRIGLALAALPVLLLVGRQALARRTSVFASFCVAALVASIGLGLPLRSQVSDPESYALDNLHRVWAFLREQPPNPGRVFVQSTFMTEPRNHPLVRSHVPALTAREAGVRQVGAYYGIVPYKTRYITGGEFGQVLGLSVRGDFDRAELARRIALSNTTQLVMVDPQAVETLVEADIAEVLVQYGRFSVLQVNADRTSWFSGDDSRIQIWEWTPGHVVFNLSADSFPMTVVAKQSYHPGWTAPPGITLAESDDGLLELTLDGPPEGVVTLSWKPYRAHTWMAASGFGVLLIWTLVSTRRRTI